MKDVAELLREQKQKTDDLRTAVLGRLQNTETATKEQWQDTLQIANTGVMDSAKKAATAMQEVDGKLMDKKARMEGLIARLVELRGQLSGSVSSDPELSKLHKELTDLKALSEHLVSDFKEKAEAIVIEVKQETDKQQEIVQNKVGEAYYALEGARQAIESYGA